MKIAGAILEGHNNRALFLEEVQLIGKYLFEAIFINSQSKFLFYLVSFRLLFAAGFVRLALTHRRWVGSLTVRENGNVRGRSFLSDRKTADTPSTANQRQSERRVQQTVGESSHGKIIFFIVN